MNLYSQDITDLMRNAEIVKAAVMRGLIRDGLIDEVRADEWCYAHAVMAHEPKWGLFARLFGKEKPGKDGLVYTLVKRAVIAKAEGTDT